MLNQCQQKINYGKFTIRETREVSITLISLFQTLFGPYNSPDSCGSSTERLIPSVEAAFLRIYSLANTGRTAGKLEVFGCVTEPYALILPEIYYHPYQVSTTKIGNYFNADHVVTSINLNWGTDISYDGVFYRPGFRIYCGGTYMIITFEIRQRVFAVVTAGGSSYYVTSYELYYGETDDAPIQAINSSQTGNSTFLGNQEDKQWIRQDLQTPVVAKYMVFKPNGINALCISRLGFLGFPEGLKNTF